MVQRSYMSQPSLKVNLPRRSGDVQLAQWNRSGSTEEEEKEEEGKEEDNYNDDAGNSTKWMVMRTSTDYARKPRDRIQISLTRDRIICFSQIPVSSHHRSSCARARARGFVAPRPPSDLCIARIARIIAMINYIIRTSATSLFHYMKTIIVLRVFNLKLKMSSKISRIIFLKLTYKKNSSQ